MQVLTGDYMKREKYIFLSRCFFEMNVEKDKPLTVTRAISSSVSTGKSSTPELVSTRLQIKTLKMREKAILTQDDFRKQRMTSEPLLVADRSRSY